MENKYTYDRYFVILFGNLSASPTSNSWGELSGGQYLQEANMIPAPTFSANNQGFHPSKVFIFKLKTDKQFFSIFISWYRIKATYFSAHQSKWDEFEYIYMYEPYLQKWFRFHYLVAYYIKSFYPTKNYFLLYWI